MAKNKKKKLIILFLICIVAFYAASHYIHQEEKMTLPIYRKVILIGIDAMDFKIVNKLMAEDKLPNFKRISEVGSFTKLNTTYPPESPVAWTTIATGVNPGKHNIFDYIRRDAKDYMPRLSLSKSSKGISSTKYGSYVKAVPFWRITSKAEFPTTIIRWPVTFPPEKIKGNMLSGLGVPDIKGLLSGYTYYTSEDIKESDKSSNKVIKVIEEAGVIKTRLFGPKMIKSDEIIDVQIPATIVKSNNSAEILIDDRRNIMKMGEWSGWIRVKFKVGLLRKVDGVFKAYLISTNPFKMYITAVQIDPENPVVKISYPDKYSAELVKRIGIYYTLGIPEETDGYIDNKLSKEAFLEQVDEVEEQRDRMFWLEFDEFKKKEKGVFAVVYDSSDRLQHVFWDERVIYGDNEGLSVNKVVEDYYIKKDDLIGEILKQIDENTLVLIFSDHGFTSFEREVNINTWLVENGYLTLTKELQYNEDGALFQYVDWSKTKAYALGFASLYINVKGRENKGIVEERKKIVEEIIERLESLTDKKTGNKVVNGAYRKEEIYKGDYVDDAPDIVIGFNPGYRMGWQTAIGGFSKEIISDNTKKWNGDHLVDPNFVPGVLFSNVRLSKDSVTLTDIAPTVLCALGIELPENMDGKCLLD